MLRTLQPLSCGGISSRIRRTNLEISFFFSSLISLAVHLHTERGRHALDRDTLLKECTRRNFSARIFIGEAGT